LQPTPQHITAPHTAPHTAPLTAPLTATTLQQGTLIKYQPRQGSYRIKLDNGKEIDLALPNDAVLLLPDGGGGGGAAAANEGKSSKKAKK